LLLLPTDAAAAAAAAGVTAAARTHGLHDAIINAWRQLILNDVAVIIYTDDVCEFINFNRVTAALGYRCIHRGGAGVQTPVFLPLVHRNN